MNRFIDAVLEPLLWLLAALNDRMEVNVKKAGAVEFAQIFDEVARQ